jgi:LmbE family N-acetylglucosaminyl deacetylase
MNTHLHGAGDGKSKQVREDRRKEIDARRAREARAAARATGKTK